MRASLLPGIWQQRHGERQASRELPPVRNRPRDSPSGRRDLPDEIPHLVAALYDRQAMARGLFELKRVAECLMPGAQTVPGGGARLRASGARRGDPVEGRGGRAPVRTASAAGGDGRARRSSIWICGWWNRSAAGETKYTPIRRYPSSAFDLSVIAPLREHAGKLEAAIAAFAGPLLESMQFVRQYAGRRWPRGRRACRSA